ncbi:ShlB/FhaC/HecB family hemolysin secretion/activation protein [Pseudomonas neustonica]|uniref:ShlB/FhaC/HecB family hemolysin secretion/activation protein n=2 Tax=Pseudomonas TaxID=286 RepID=A0ABX9XH93_9PSED|nr:ShlB/FhaC/HecB family hemolysin secretion/activation protein [Pseudomonas sp. SSM44]ROZ84285.1 ShlB/FhaC/HecB family hemolysin secretion/activation protein [Pseudomonas neustonica]
MTTQSRTSKRVWMLAVAAMLPCVVEAQVVLPGGVSPGQVNPSLQREQIDAQRRQQAIEERARRVDIPALQGEQPEQGDALPADSPPFVLSGISFNTSVFITQEQLKEIAGQYVGREITFADLNQMIRQVNKLYADDGQLTARAIIPPQSLDDGQLRVVLVEAKLDGVNFTGEGESVDEAFYRERLNLTEGETLNSPMLIEAIRRFNATSQGPQISAGLAPGERFGTTRVDVERFEPKRFDWSLFANNYGSEGTGYEQLGGTLNWFSPTGAADNISAVLVGTRGSQYMNLRYSRPVNRRNGFAWVEAGANSMEIKRGPLADLNIEGDSSNYGIGFDQPWWLSDRWLLLGGLGYTSQTSETTLEGVTLSEVDIQEVFLKGQFEYRAAPWYARYEQRIRQASPDNALTGDSGNFTILTGDLYTSRQLSERYELVGKAGWQYATRQEELPSALHKQFGGISAQRGYEPGIITSPWGANFSVEGYWSANDRWQPFVFMDYGRAMELGDEDVDLISGGAGVNSRWWNDRVSASLLVAGAFKDVVPDQDSGQVLLQLVFR